MPVVNSAIDALNFIVDWVNSNKHLILSSFIIVIIATLVSLTITLVAQASNTTGKTRASGEVITGVAVGATILVLFVFLGILFGCLCWYLRKIAKRRHKKENQRIVDQFVAE